MGKPSKCDVANNIYHPEYGHKEGSLLVAHSDTQSSNRTHQSATDTEIQNEPSKNEQGSSPGKLFDKELNDRSQDEVSSHEQYASSVSWGAAITEGKGYGGKLPREIAVTVSEWPSSVLRRTQSVTPGNVRQLIPMWFISKNVSRISIFNSQSSKNLSPEVLQCQSGISEPSENPAVHAASIQSREQVGNQMVKKPMGTAAHRLSLYCEPLVTPGHDGGHRPEGLLHGRQGPEQERHPDPEVPNITKWKDMEKIWCHSCNGCEEQDLPNPKASVEKMAPFTLQTFSTPAMYINHPGCSCCLYFYHWCSEEFQQQRPPGAETSPEKSNTFLTATSSPWQPTVCSCELSFSLPFQAWNPASFTNYLQRHRVTICTSMSAALPPTWGCAYLAQTQFSESHLGRKGHH
ncbi:hypothetical protein U0070_008693, partial [Myodes glareolus]